MIMAWRRAVSEAIGLDALYCQAYGSARIMLGRPAQSPQLGGVAAEARHVTRPATGAAGIDDFSTGRAELGDHDFGNLLHRCGALTCGIIDRQCGFRLGPS